ncbi:MAG: 4-hydroxy-tetrahydrodipicolinate synthase [Candidatus Tectomicrobia bacterium]|uniref:4-hydroxy-tetrahydrodipicolinate synthase n=1 Tax=Tectimicrobiota bacterium TaxID=2528274 RepID=A0A933GLK4_UNCTE|nr:4-hydroxy-tetrahydrodipicolinate synthase [Candidatus Tectomicrobia bacterium]
MFAGSFVAIVTPFRNGQIDEKSLSELIEFQLKEGTHGIVPCGSTGESATLSHQEHERVIEHTIRVVDGRVPVIAGTGSNSTEEALKLTRHAKKVGADGALMITPYYNKPTQEGLYRHFSLIAEKVDIPIVLYNVPGRTGVNMTPQTVERLAQIPNIVGIKEASGSLQQISDLINLCGDKITVLSGDDGLTLPILSVGGKGVISVTANILPADAASLVTEFEAGNWLKAREINSYLHTINQALFIETNPIPVKTALALMEKISGELRLPLCPMSENNLNTLKQVMKRYNLIP